MTKRDFVSRVTNQLSMITKDDYRSDRFILFTGKNIVKKLISQKLKKRSLNKDMSLFREVRCIEFEPINSFSCNYVEFRNCKELSVSKCSFKNLIYTKNGSSIKQLYSIDRQNIFYPSDLHTLRLNNLREVQSDDAKFYLLDDKIYIPHNVKTLNMLVLSTDIEDIKKCGVCDEDEQNCQSLWESDFICPDDLEEDVLNLTIQNIIQSKQIPLDENPNLNNNQK